MEIRLSEHDIYRIVKDLLEDVVSRRRGRDDFHIIFEPDACFTDEKWAIDSLEILEMTSSVYEMFHLYKSSPEESLFRLNYLTQWVKLVHHSWQRYSETITFRTSGSIKLPKPCTHDVMALIQEAAEEAKLLKNRKRLISMIPAHHIYGFTFTILVPHILNIEVIDGRQMDTETLVRILKPGDVIISFPLGWAELEKKISKWPLDIWGITSTNPCFSDTIKSLRQKGLSNFIDIYGASETGAVGFRHYPDQPYTLFSYWQRGISNGSNNPHIIRTLSKNRGEETILPMDILKWFTDRTFLVMDRRYGSVQVGGIKVHPNKIAEQIRQHPLVQECAVRIIQYLDYPCFKAFVVPKCDINSVFLRSELNHWFFKKLSSYERPIHLTFGKNLPLDALGKCLDW